MKKLVALLAAAFAGAFTLNAATPVAVWDGDFTTLTKGTFTLSENGNTKTDSYLQISGDNGITVTSTDALNIFTVIIRCSGLNLAAENAQVLFTSYANDTVDNNDYRNLTGVNLPANNAVCRGIWSAADWNSGATQGSVPANYTTLIYNHQQTSGTYAYALGPTSDMDETVVRTTLYSVEGLRSSGTTYKGFAVGGLRGTTSTTLLPATGLKITSIAVFSGTLTEAEMKAYSFPSETQTINITSDTSVSAINGQIDSGRQGVDLVVTDGVTITFDTQFTPASVNVTSSGSITLSAKAPPSAAELAKLDLSGVQGSVVRTWLNPGVVGYNFRNDAGGDTVGQLATGGAWLISANSANGTDTGLFADGLSKLSWSASGTYASGVGSSITTGYLDDNSSQSPVIMLSAVPYASYDVVIYCSTDSDNFKFSAKEVNGKLYTWNGSQTVETTDSNAAWGQSKSATIVEGTNALRINGLTGPLTIKGGKYSNTADLKCRSCIAAIQIMPAGVSSGKSEIVIDAREGWTTSDSDMLGSIRTSYRNVRVLGIGQYGATLDFGYLNDDSMYISSHVVFDGGKHAVTINGAGDSTIGSNASEPILEVLDNTTLDFYQHDLSGWLGSAAAKVPTCNIQVDAGGQMNIRLNGAGTTYYQGRYTIYPGATVTSYVTTGNGTGPYLRFNGGAVEGAEQIYVPATTTSEPGLARFNGVEGNSGIFLASDATAGMGIFVGDNSTLEFDLDIAGVAAAPLAKWGEGTVNFNGNLSGYAGTLTINEGTVNIGSETTLQNVVNNGTLTFTYGTMISAYSGAGNVVVDVSSLVDGGAVVSGSYTLLPGATVDPGNVEVTGLPEESGFSVHVTEDGIVLTDAFCTDWTGPSGSWTETTFDGRTGSTDGKIVYFANSLGNDEVAVTVAGDKSVSSMVFLVGDTAYTLLGDQITTEGITVSGVSPVVISNKVVVSGSVVLNADTELTLATNDVSLASGALSGSGTLVLDPGEGNEFTMSTANTSFTGEAVIASGTVKMGDAKSFGPVPCVNVIRVKGAATLDENGARTDYYSDSMEKNCVVLEKGATFTQSETPSDEKQAPVSSITLEGDALIDASKARVTVSQHYNYCYTKVNLGTNTLEKIGTHDFFLSATTISGTGVLHVKNGSLTISPSYYDNALNSSCEDGTLVFDSGTSLRMQAYQNRSIYFTAKNLVLDGEVFRGSESSSLTVTGYVTGNGTTPMLTLAEGAVFKPTGTGYLTITESLNGTMIIDLSDIDFASFKPVPLFKVGSAEMLPDASELSFTREIPKGWKLSVTAGGCGYKLSPEPFRLHIR